jgi:hypothetical protein
MASPTNPNTHPKWMTNLAERKRLSIAEPQMVKTKERYDHMTDLSEEHNPLFDKKASIKYTPQDDGTAQFMYRDSSKLKANEKKPQFPKSAEGKSGYDFGALMD